MTKSQTDSTKTALLSVRISQKLHDDLVQAAGDEGGIATEVRRRLAASFDKEAIVPTDDPKEREAIAAIAWALTHYSYGVGGPDAPGQRWHEHPHGFYVVTGAIRQIMENFKPAGGDEPADERETSHREGMAQMLAT